MLRTLPRETKYSTSIPQMIALVALSSLVRGVLRTFASCKYTESKGFRADVEVEDDGKRS